MAGTTNVFNVIISSIICKLQHNIILITPHMNSIRRTRKLGLILNEYKNEN